MKVRLDPEQVKERKLDGKGRASLRELADPGQTVEIAVLEVIDEEKNREEES